ncbi:MAG: Hpt domain-containing protein [Ignavibacteria bacterium]
MEEQKPLIDWDIVNGLMELGEEDGKSFVKEIIDLYISQYPELFDGMQRGYQQAQAKEMTLNAHSLKGASLNIGALQLAEICREIEMRGRNNDFSGVDSLIEEVENVYNLTIEEFKKFLT